MGPVVVDASAFVAYLLRAGSYAQVEAVLTNARTDPHVPELCDVEVASALRRGLLRGLIEAERASEALDDYLALQVTRHGHQRLLSRGLELRNNFSTYDATYVALAERLGASFLTADTRLANAVRQHGALQVLPE